MYSRSDLAENTSRIAEGKIKAVKDLDIDQDVSVYFIALYILLSLSLAVSMITHYHV